MDPQLSFIHSLFLSLRNEGAHPDEAEAESSRNPCADAAGGCGDVVFVDDELLSGGALLPGQNGVTQKVTLPSSFLHKTPCSYCMWQRDIVGVAHHITTWILWMCWMPLMVLLTVHQPQLS